MAHDAATEVSGKLVIRNIGLMLSGALERPILDADALVAIDGRIAAIGRLKDLDTEGATTIVDANGCALAPGLIDSHVHPVAGDWTPRQSQLNWIDSSMHGGVTTMISAGEVHTPGADGGVRPSDCVPHLELCRADADCEYGLISLVSMPADTVGFAYWVGTSFAAPLVSGIAADALENGVPPEKVTTYIVDSAVRTGVVDASAATKP